MKITRIRRCSFYFASETPSFAKEICRTEQPCRLSCQRNQKGHKIVLGNSIVTADLESMKLLFNDEKTNNAVARNMGGTKLARRAPQQPAPHDATPNGWRKALQID